MPWINTATIGRGKALEEMVSLQVYNGLDCGVTFEVWESLHSDLTSVPHRAAAELIYGFERAMQAPSFAMTHRGVLVDREWRGIIRHQLSTELETHTRRFNKLANAVWDRDLNPQSPKQLQDFFYNVLKIPPIYKYSKGKSSITTDREALEKIQDYKYGAIFSRYIILMRDLAKKISVLSKKLSPDNRMRCSYNVTGTETGRWSSSEDPFGDGDNLQNWTKRMRRMVVADPGKKLFSIDLAQAESFVVGGAGYRDTNGKYSGYLAACEKGVHLSVAKSVWPELGWSSNDDEYNKESVAGQYFYHQHTYYDTTKRLGHGSNYYGKPFQMSKQTKIEQNTVAAFQTKYFRSFPEIPAYHRSQAQRLQLDFYITTALGRVRYFFGRPDDDATLRKAIAFEPQSTVGDLLNLGLWRVWYHEEHTRGSLELLLQVHDNIVFQLPDDPADPDNHAKQRAVILRVLEHLDIPLQYRDKTIHIPADVECGWNWATVKSYSKDKTKNPDGLKTWKADEIDGRKRQSDPSATGLDRVLY